MPNYSKSKKLTKEDIFKKFEGDNNLLSCLPDEPDIKSISRELLLSILFYGDREKYLKLYEEYKDLEMQKSTTGNKKYIAQVSEEMLMYLRNFQPVDFYVTKLLII